MLFGRAKLSSKQKKTFLLESPFKFIKFFTTSWSFMASLNKSQKFGRKEFSQFDATYIQAAVSL